MVEYLENVSFSGLGSDGGPVFDLNLTFPDPLEGEMPCSKRQMENVIDVYGDIFSPLSCSQADALLSARSWGHFYTRKVGFRSTYKVKNLMATVLAVMVLSNDDATRAVIEWSNNNFDRQQKPDPEEMLHFWFLDEAFRSLLDRDPILKEFVTLE